MRRIVKPKTVTFAQAAIHLDPSHKVLRAQSATLWRRLQCERSAGPEGVAEFPRRVREGLRGKRVFGEIPAFEAAGQNELQLHFMDAFLAILRVRSEEVRFHIVAFDFFEDLVRAV